MTRAGELEKREASRKRLGSLESGAKSERAKKKARPTERVAKLPRKRAWNEVTETEYLNGEQVSSKRNSISQSSSRKVSRVGSLKKHGDDGEKLTADRGSRGLKPSTQEPVGTLWENGDAQGPDLPQRKWKRTPKVANCLDSTAAPSGSCLRGAFGDQLDDRRTRSGMEEEKQKQSRENKVTRESLRTVHLGESRTAGEKKTIAEHEEASIGFEKESAGVVSISEQTALHGKDRKRREADMGDDSPPKPSEKKRRVHVAGAEASHRSAEQGTWKRRKRHNKGNSGAASEDMGVSISEAWKRLREWKDTETSGSSVNGRSDSDLSMHSCPSIPEWIETRPKKARYDSPSPPPPVERKWKRYRREKKQSSSSKRQRDGNGCESSGSSGSEMAQSSYLHNRKWKRPRYENLMTAQGRSLRRQPRDG